jgi:hypothetical protein
MKLPPVNYSLHREFEQCPRKTWHLKIAKTVPFEETKAIKWGNKVHSAFERRINYGDSFPPGIECYEDYCKFPDHYEVKAELQLGMRENGAACNFFADDVWARGKIDVLCTTPHRPSMAIIIDHKTGKKREDPHELQFHAVLLKAYRPQFTTIKGWYNWLATNEMGRVYDLSDTELVLEEMRGTRVTMERLFPLGERAWPPRQTPLCGWCSVRSCEFNPSYEAQQVAK